MTTSLPLIMDSSGPVPQPPATVRSALIQLVSATNPDYTSNLPGSLVEDISSTDVAAILLCGSAQIDLVNSVSPRTANAFITNQLGQMMGIQPGQPTNTSVSVTFSGPPGFVVVEGFTVSDGTYQYQIQDGGIIGTDGTSDALFAIATNPGSFAVPAGSVNQIVTSVPSGITLTVVNQLPGTPGSAAAETQESYRARTQQAGLAIAQGMPSLLRTLLGKVPTVQTRLISIRQATGGGWEIIVGGGDPYKVAYAIFSSLFDISTLVGSTINVLSISKAGFAQVVTDINHGYNVGDIVTLENCLGMTQINGLPLRVQIVTDEKTFSLNVNSAAFSTYLGGGIATPNKRNVVVSILDAPDTYEVPFVVPPQQSVHISLLWNTTSTNPVSEAAMAQLGGPAIQNYVNGIYAGQPINLFELQSVFQSAVSSLIDPQLLTRMAFTVSIDGVGVVPQVGTGIIAGDPESYFFIQLTDVDIAQG